MAKSTASKKSSKVKPVQPGTENKTAVRNERGAGVKPKSFYVEKELSELIHQTGAIAGKKETEKLPAGDAIEKEMAAKDAPKEKPEPTTQPEEKKEEEKKDGQQKTESSSTDQKKNSEGDRTVAMMVNSLLSPFAAKWAKKDQLDVMLKEDQIKALMEVQPNSGLNVKSWWIFFLFAASLIGQNISLAKASGKGDVPVDDLIKVLMQMGYKITKDIDPKVLEELRAMGYEVKKRQTDLDMMAEKLREAGYKVSKLTVENKIEDAEIIP